MSVGWKVRARDDIRWEGVKDKWMNSKSIKNYCILSSSPRLFWKGGLIEEEDEYEGTNRECGGRGSDGEEEESEGGM